MAEPPSVAAVPSCRGDGSSGCTGDDPLAGDAPLAGDDPLAGDLPLAVVILPPREGFGPGRAGALGLLARRYATAPGFRTLVIGGAQQTPPFAEVPFQAI